MSLSLFSVYSPNTSNLIWNTFSGADLGWISKCSEAMWGGPWPTIVRLGLDLRVARPITSGSNFNSEKV